MLAMGEGFVVYSINNARQATIASAALVTAVGSNSTRGVNSGFCQTFDRRVVMVLR
jgi:hypothetical protein